MIFLSLSLCRSSCRNSTEHVKVFSFAPPRGGIVQVPWQKKPSLVRWFARSFVDGHGDAEFVGSSTATGFGNQDCCLVCRFAVLLVVALFNEVERGRNRRRDEETKRRALSAAKLQQFACQQTNGRSDECCPRQNCGVLPASRRADEVTSGRSDECCLRQSCGVSPTSKRTDERAK